MRSQNSQGLLITSAPSGGLLKILLFLLLFVSISFSQKLKVLYEDGRVGVVDATKTSLNALQRVVYTEKPIRVKYLDQLVYSSSVAIRGSGPFNFSINTSPGQNLSVLSAGASVSFSGACSGGLDNLFCSGGPLNFNVSSSSDWRLIVQSVGKNIFLSDVSTSAYYLGTGAVNTGRTGRNVLVGVVDSGIDLCHPAFKKPDGSSKVLFLYDLATNREYNRQQIQSLIASGNCNFDSLGHGTSVAGVISYIARDADLVVVKLPDQMTDADVMQAFDYLRNKKDQLGRPMVVNVSLGYNVGPHDGTSLIERKIAQLSGPGFVVVVANGNDGGRRVYGRIGALSGSASVDIYSQGEGVIDLWYSGGTLRGEFCVGSSCLSASPGESKTASFGGCSVDMKNVYPSPLNGDGNLRIETNCTGDLTVRLYSIGGTPRVDVYIFSLFDAMELKNHFLDDGFGGYLGTVLVPATSPKVISVGAISSSFCSQRSYQNLGFIAPFSSRGPTRDGRIKPEVVAAGHCVRTPMAGFQSYRDSAGTSFSTPVVAGLVALLLESNPNLDVDAVRNILTSNALRDSAVGNVPNNLYGWGKAFLPPEAVPGGGSPGGSGGSSGGGGGGCNSASPDLYTALLALVLTAVLRKRIRRVL